MDTCNLVIFMDKSDSSKTKNNFNEDTYQEIQGK
jgi:hypothetical protein